MNDIATIDNETGEVMHEAPGALSIMEQSEIATQIAAAREYPRSLARVANTIYSLVTLDEDAAQECIYTLPRGGKPIKGPSIRFAECLKSAFGNCRVSSRVIEVNKKEKYLVAEGVFHDLENNTATAQRVTRRISKSSGQLYTDDMIVMTGNAACSVAIRNAILGGVPRPLWRRAYEKANELLTGDVKSLSESRDLALKTFNAMDVPNEKVFVAIGVSGIDDITLDHIGLLRGMVATLKNGESSVAEMFPDPKKGNEGSEHDPFAGVAEKANAAKSKNKPSAKSEETPSGDQQGEDGKSPSPNLHEAHNDGVRAFNDGEERKAPEELTPEECKAWLAGFDEAAKEAEAPDEK